MPKRVALSPQFGRTQGGHGMAHTALSSRSRRLLLAPALTLAVAAPLVVTSTASACWCPTGMHESAPGSETCVTDTPPAETVTPPATPETPADAARPRPCPGPPRSGTGRRDPRARPGAGPRPGARRRRRRSRSRPGRRGGGGRGPGRARRLQAAQEGGEEDRRDGLRGPDHGRRRGPRRGHRDRPAAVHRARHRPHRRHRREHAGRRDHPAPPHAARRLVRPAFQGRHDGHPPPRVAVVVRRWTPPVLANAARKLEPGRGSRVMT